MTENDRLKRQTASLSIASNTVLVLAKLLVGLSIGAVSLISEALHSGVDLLAAMIAWLAVRKSVEPPDMEHDYGHGKFENLSAAAEALLIVGAAFAIVWEAIEALLLEPEVPKGLGYGVVIMLFSIIINLAVSQRLLRVARLTGSQALEADGLHLRADIWTSVGVLVGMFAMEITGWAPLDAVIAIFVAGIIFREGWHMARRASLELTDASLPEEEEERIGEILKSAPEVKGIHCLRTRKSGSCKLLDVHLLFDGSMHLARVHAVCDELEEKIREAFGTFDVVIHPEPYEGHRPETKAMLYLESRGGEVQ